MLLFHRDGVCFLFPLNENMLSDRASNAVFPFFFSFFDLCFRKSLRLMKSIQIIKCNENPD